MSNASPELLLASRSEARRKMLEAAGILFRAVESDLDEDEAKHGLAAAGFEPRDLAEMLAEMKALGVSEAGGAIVIGADQVLEREDGSMLSKPNSREEALDQLRSLSGRSHWLHSAAVAVRDGTRIWGETETVVLAVRPLGSGFLEAYLDAEYEAIRWSVGGYRIEGRGVQLFDAIEGSHFAILGLPLLPLLRFLRDQDMLPR
jgi:septum formation protein